MKDELKYINKIIPSDKIFLDKKPVTDNVISDYSELVRNLFDDFNHRSSPHNHIVVSRIEREFSELEWVYNISVQDNDLPFIHTTLNLLIDKLKELIDIIQLHGTQFDKNKLPELNTKLVTYIRSLDDLDLRFNAFTQLSQLIDDYKVKYKWFWRTKVFDKNLAKKLLQEAQDIIKCIKLLWKYINYELHYFEWVVNNLKEKMYQYDTKNSNLPKIDLEVALSIFWISKSELSETNLKKQYRRLASKLHPDKNPWQDTNEQMSRLNQARDFLQNLV